MTQIQASCLKSNSPTRMTPTKTGTTAVLPVPVEPLITADSLPEILTRVKEVKGIPAKELAVREIREVSIRGGLIPSIRAVIPEAPKTEVQIPAR